jgi:4-hydroxy-4-methyl-2-oxoglutarate aldolase
MAEHKLLTHSEMLELRRWNTPTVYNGWEQITRHNTGRDAFNVEVTVDFMPQMGAMVGRAVTVVCQPGNLAHPQKNPHAWSEYRRYVAGISGPKIVIVQDLDKPQIYGAFWGEVNANVHRALGCVGTITDGGIRDLDEMAYAGFKALGRRLCVGHAFSCPVSWGDPVEVFGQRVEPGQLIHADKHGFLAVPAEDEENLLEAARFMDSNECRTMISAARETAGMSSEEMLNSIDEAVKTFGERAKAQFNRRGEF